MNARTTRVGALVAILCTAILESPNNTNNAPSSPSQLPLSPCPSRPRGDNPSTGEPSLSESAMDGQEALNLPEIHPPPNSAHTDCLICEGQFPSVETQQKNGHCWIAELDNGSAQAHLSRLLYNTEKNLQHVRNMLHSHGDLILARWKKYTPKRRTELLKEASPTVFDIPSLESHDKFTSSHDTATAFASWLNTAELSGDRMRLMPVLHVRSEYGPEQWAAFDTR